jgi:probable phosphoglycerate mutase
MPNQLYLCRHGDTEWSPVRRLAGTTDLDLTAIGEATAREVGKRLAGVTFARVLASPLVRARRTAELAGFAHAVIDARLREMNFGIYEGKTVHEIRVDVPGWTYLGSGCPGGETAAEVAARIDPVLAEVKAQEGITLIVAHSVLLRVLAARYLGLPPERGRNFMLAPGGVGILEHDPVEDSPAIKAWNLGAASY